ncbi:MAG: ATP synthase F0 subunit B [Deltaproteobacteria bacterium]|nr:ATP synthase F0 subunit B [Deltaproteobacteria bacterium]
MNYLDSPHLIRVFDFGALHLELNTPVFLFVLIMVVMFLLNALLFRPVMRSVENRTKHLDQTKTGIAENQKTIQRLQEEFQAKLSKVKADIAQIRMEARRKTQMETEGILKEAKKTAEDELRKALDTMNQEVGSVRKELLDRSGALAKQVATQVLK